MELLKHTDTESILIFTRTKHRAKRIGQQLEKAGYKAASLQGNLSQNRRQAALDGFRDGSYQILVATDIAARGIDVSTHLPCHQLRHPRHDRRLYAPHRPHRPRRQDRRRLYLRHAARTSRWSGASSACSARRSSAASLKDFDYKKSAPARDAEFARPPREPQRRRTQPKAEHGASHGAGARPKTHAAHPQRGSAPAGSSKPAAHPTSTRSFRPRTGKPGSSR